jgi:pyridoxine kinase
VVLGIDERGVLGRVDAVLSGYQGARDVGAEVLKAVELVKTRNDKAIYCCDPVIGDEGRGIYVREGIPEYMRDVVVPKAQIVTPNHFELDFLTGTKSQTLAELLAAGERLRERGPEVVLVTSAILPDMRPDTITMVALGADGAWKVTTPRFERSFTGSGDMTAALFLARYLQTGGAVPQALGDTADAVYSVLKVTVERGQSELALVAAQDEIVRPSEHFEVEAL